VAISSEFNAATAERKGAPYETPRALATSEVEGVVAAFQQAAKNALAAGFDGVEIHGANGTSDRAIPVVAPQSAHRPLRRLDREPRALLLEVTQAAIDVWGANRLGVRLPPYGVANGSGEPDPIPLYMHAIQQLNPLGLACLHFIEPRSSGAGRAEVNWQNVPSAMVLFRPIWKGVLITAGGSSGEAAEAAIAAGHAEAIAFWSHLHLQPRSAAPAPARLAADTL
jgi:N-ethylmaleimide reductase